MPPKSDRIAGCSMIFNCGTQQGGVAVRYLRRIFPKRDAGHRPEQLDDHDVEKYENN